jgi:two-component sensor histidine kinase/CheY-like chemotaxis protein
MTATPVQVLYIDDDEGLRVLVKRALERRGYRVTTAGSGAEGMALAVAHKFDVAAVDHYMPDLDGLATLAQLQQIADPPPVVYVTGSDESRVAVGALKSGAVDFVVKAPGDTFFDLLDKTFQQALAQLRLSRDKAEAEAALRATNARLEAMLREVNHRVANSLQLVSAFVQMQAGMLNDSGAREALEDTQRRIAAIMQVHRKLYTSDDVEAVDMTGYLSTLLRELEETWSAPESPRRLSLIADPVRLQTDRAVSVGVIVNELVTNACKYAYPADREGEIRVSLRQDGPESLLLAVEDDGVGIQAEQPAKGTGLGGRIVGAMATSLKSQLRYEHAGPGVRVSLRIAVR